MCVCVCGKKKCRAAGAADPSIHFFLPMAPMVGSFAPHSGLGGSEGWVEGEGREIIFNSFLIFLFCFSFIQLFLTYLKLNYIVICNLSGSTHTIVLVIVTR